MRKCLKCEDYFRYQNEYVQHMIECHPELGIRQEIIYFNRISEFEQWKRKAEERGHCRWRQNSGMRRNMYERRQTYCCRQSVLAKSDAKRSCPSSIQVSINVRTGHVVVIFYPTHLGHNPADDPPIAETKPKPSKTRHKYFLHSDLLPTPFRLNQSDLKICDISNVIPKHNYDHDYEPKPLFLDDNSIATVEIDSSTEMTPTSQRFYEQFVSSLYRHSELANQHSVEQIAMVKDQIESILKQNNMFVSDC